MCKVALANHPEREPVGDAVSVLRVMKFEGRLIPITVHTDSQGIFHYTPWQVQLLAEGQTEDELRANVLRLLDEALAKGVLSAVEPCKVAKGAGV